MDGKSIVIIPTYNELENISVLIPDLMDRYPHLDILIVDDNSPDGTAGYVKKMQENNGCIKLIERSGKMGLGTAYVAGFRFMLENGYDYAIQMDADYSHDPKEIGNFFREIRNCDLVIGSRYITGVNVVNWPMRRLLLSYFASYYTRFITGIPVADCTGGFKMFRRKVLETINLQDIRSNGYSFQIEMNYKAWKAGFKIKEIPIIFIDRVKGRSKMNKKIVREAVLMVWKLRFKSIFGRL
ncbi:MAG: polyprenol monophosphomannose synthase [Ignavibacteria bacterium]|jgi:dolichol-phosphate mannosyltransferase|nr:polyprenol monophosphomannose synthase [Ignavibacteria bacterium]HEX2963132.1 polyprenol monophosphomannose synthase [Ignavibacteriales bacterium]MCU7499589.1 polyprenol monophosphomannose synthase [Ignavibacteria bacterium]MCU7513024.1 polyprenol monophosphomannose synthase [Ignavibacteria bacterium]MCU7519291.1 polyprenol monophosphomannose synthase [Ignavibacteria bacterium]